MSVICCLSVPAGLFTFLVTTLFFALCEMNISSRCFLATCLKLGIGSIKTLLFLPLLVGTLIVSFSSIAKITE